MLAAVGQDAPFDQGRGQMKLLADLEVTAKALERTAEGIGADIAARRREEIERATRGELPLVLNGPPIPILCGENGRDRIVRGEKGNRGPEGQDGRATGNTREAKLCAVFTQTKWDEEGYAIRDPDSTTYTGGQKE